MARLYLLFFLFLPLPFYSQSVTELESQREKIAIQIKLLQDSLLSVENHIDRIKRGKQKEGENGKEKEEIEVLPEIPQLKVPEDTVLKSLPGGLGEDMMKIKEGTLVQKIDEVKDYYLVCISGNCGYLPKGIFANAQQDELKRED